MNSVSVWVSRLITATGLWAVLVPALVFMAVALTPIYPADFWWHLTFGEQVLAGEGMPRTDAYSFVAEGRPYVQQPWLAGVIFALVYQTGGFALLIVMNALLFAAGYSLALAESARASGGVRSAALATLFGFLLSVENWALRPQSFSVLLLPLMLLVLRRYLDGRLSARGLAILPLLTGLWANLHGAFIIGLAVQAIVIGGLFLSRTLTHLARRGTLPHAWAVVGKHPRSSSAHGSTSSPRTGEISSPRTGEIGSPRTEGTTPFDGSPRVLPLALAGLASGAAACLTPWGPGVYVFVLTYVMSPVLKSFVLEWAPTSLIFLPGRLLLAYAVLFLGVLALSRRRPRFAETLLILAFGWLALSTVRSVIWLGIVAGPTLAMALATVGNHMPSWGRDLPQEEQPSPWGLVPLGALALLVALSLPWMRPLLPLPEDRRAWLTPDTPVAAAAVLRDMEPGRRTFHDMLFGSYLMWAAWPRQQVFRDPRFELYSYEEWADYGTMTLGLDALPLLDRERIDTLLLHRERQAGLLAAVAADGRWKQVYEDRFTRIYRRRPPLH